MVQRPRIRTAIILAGALGSDPLSDTGFNYHDIESSKSITTGDFPGTLNNYLTVLLGKQTVDRVPEKYLLTTVFNNYKPADAQHKIDLQRKSLERYAGKLILFDKKATTLQGLCEGTAPLPLTDSEFEQFRITAMAPVDSLPLIKNLERAKIHQFVTQRERQMLDGFIQKTYTDMQQEFCLPNLNNSATAFQDKLIKEKAASRACNAAK